MSNLYMGPTYLYNFLHCLRPNLHAYRTIIRVRMLSRELTVLNWKKYTNLMTRALLGTLVWY